MSGTAPHPSMSDTAAMMHYDANKKSVLVAYLLWFFLGWFGAHRFYADRTGSAIVMLLVSVVSWALSAVLIGYVGLGFIGAWLLVDVFLIPGMIGRYNRNLIAALGR